MNILKIIFTFGTELYIAHTEGDNANVIKKKVFGGDVLTTPVARGGGCSGGSDEPPLKTNKHY